MAVWQALFAAAITVWYRQIADRRVVARPHRGLAYARPATRVAVPRLWRGNRLTPTSSTLAVYLLSSSGQDKTEACSGRKICHRSNVISHTKATASVFIVISVQGEPARRMTLH